MKTYIMKDLHDHTYDIWKKVLHSVNGAMYQVNIAPFNRHIRETIIEEVKNKTNFPKGLTFRDDNNPLWR